MASLFCLTGNCTPCQVKKLCGDRISKRPPADRTSEKAPAASRSAQKEKAAALKTGKCLTEPSFL